jgi:hypothetical protein
MRREADRWSLLALSVVLAGCKTPPSTLALLVTTDPASLTFATLRVEVAQAGRAITHRDFDWPADGPNVGVYLPSDVTGEVVAMAQGLDRGGTVVGTGQARAQVTAGKASAPVPLLLRAVVPPPADAGPPDAPIADTAVDIAPPGDDRPPDHPGPEVSPDAAAADRPPAPAEAPRPLRPFNGEATGSVFSAAALRPRFRWLPVAGATSYDIDLDGSCLPETLASCPFSSPQVHASVPNASFVPAAPLDVSRTAPVGRRYAWRVRACNGTGCGPWSPVRYVDVGRQSKDYNGDGYADVVVGTGAASPLAVFLGGAPPDTRADLQIPVDAQSVDVRVAAAGDVNGDGFADLAIGEPDLGKVLLVFGAATLHGTADVTLTGSPDDQFGQAVAGAGDVDGDGFADVIVGAPGAKPAAAHLFRGGRQGTRPAITFSSASKLFGRVVSSAGDMNGDGYADVLVAAELQTSLYLGGAAFDTTPDLVYAAFPKMEGGLAPLGDVDGDGYGDIVIVAPEVVVRTGGATPADVGTTLAEAGWSASAGDVNGDGLGDLLMRGIHESAYLYLGGRPWQSGFALELKDPADTGYAGSVSVVGDVNGDGFADLVVGAPDRVIGGQALGAADLFLGGATPDAQADLSFPGARADDFFGGALAWLRRPPRGGRR